MAEDIVQDPRDDRWPDRIAGQAAKIGNGGDDAQLQRLLVAGIDHRDWPRRHLRAVLARGDGVTPQELGHLGQRFDRGRESDALHTAAGQVFQTFQAERQVGAAFVAAQGVDFIDDHRFDGAQDVARLGAGEHQVERFGGGDQDVRGIFDHARAHALRGVAGAYGRTQRRPAHSQMPRRGLDAGQRRPQVAFDIVVQRLER